MALIPVESIKREVQIVRFGFALNVLNLDLTTEKQFRMIHIFEECCGSQLYYVDRFIKTLENSMLINTVLIRCLDSMVNQKGI